MRRTLLLLLLLVVLVYVKVNIPDTYKGPRVSIYPLTVGENCITIMRRSIFRMQEREGFQGIYKCSTLVLLEDEPTPEVLI